MEAFLRGILCNILVCLAVWLSYTAQNVAGKVPGDHPAGGGFRGAGLRALGCQYVFHFGRHVGRGGGCKHVWICRQSSTGYTLKHSRRWRVYSVLFWMIYLRSVREKKAG